MKHSNFLHPANAEELATIAQETDAEVLHGALHYPSDTMLARVTPSEKTREGYEKELDKLGPLFERKPKLFADGVLDPQDLDGFSARQKKAFREAFERLKRFANTHPGLRLHEVLDDQTLSPSDKMQRVNARLGLLGRVQEKNPTIEFLGVDYTPGSADLGKIDFEGLSEEEQRMVLADWKAYQRIYLLTHDVDETQILLANGYHSASSIANITYRSFEGSIDLDESTAKRIWDNAKKWQIKTAGDRSAYGRHGRDCVTVSGHCRLSDCF